MAKSSEQFEQEEISPSPSSRQNSGDGPLYPPSIFREGRTIASFFVSTTLIAILYFAREILIPFALAILISFCLAPLLRWFERLRLGRILAVSIVCAISFSIVGVFGWIMINQLVDLASKLPEYKSNVYDKIHSLQGELGSFLTKAARTAQELENEVTANTTSTLVNPQPLSPAHLDAQKAIPVQVIESPSDAIDLIASTLTSLLDPIATAGLVLVFTIFILINREDLRNKFIRLVAHGDLIRTTKALDEATSRVTSYLLTNLFLNLTHGVILAVGLYAFGLPNAVMWGILAAILRFVPYLGPCISSIGPIIISLAIFDNWTQPLVIVGFLVALELVSNNILEPWLYGSGTGLSPISVLVAAVFWTWLWDGVGLLMSMPLTVCLLVVGRYVHQGEFLYILLGDQPMLPLPDRFYQRLLSMDQKEATGIVEEYLKENSIEALYDSVLIAALVLSRRDQYRRLLEGSAQMYVLQTTRELIEDLMERDRRAKEGGETISPSNLPAAEIGTASLRRTLLCLPLTDESEELVCLMLSHSLEREGWTTEILSSQFLAGEILEHMDQANPVVVCLSVLPPYAISRVRYLAKKLYTRFPEIRIIVGLWSAPFDVQVTKQRLQTVGVLEVVTTIAEFSKKLQGLGNGQEVSRSNTAARLPLRSE